MTGNDGGSVRNRCAFGYADREWAEFALGLLDAREAAEMEAHASLCGVCSGRRAEWLRLAPARDGGRREAPSVPPLPERRRRSLRRTVRAIGLRRRLRGPAITAAAAAAVVLLAVGLLQRIGFDANPFGSAAPAAHRESPGEYMMMFEPEAGPVLAAPDTTQFRVVHGFGTAGEGYMWLSGDAREALLYLLGLPDTDLFDYQAWAMRGPQADSLGVLKLVDGIAHLHIRSVLLPDAEMISLSAEPKGGSDQPTSPPTALVLFEARR
jgi:hypothetical protein